MSELDTKSSDASQLAELREQCAELRRQTSSMLLALVVASLILAAFLGLQVRRASKDLTGLRKQAAQLEDWSKKAPPAIQEFAGKLIEYSRSHPALVPILLKHGINPTNAPAALGSMAPAPAGGTPAKK